MNYKVILLSSVQGTSKKSGNPYYMMTVLITVSDNKGNVVQNYTTNVFLDAEKYDFVKELAPMTALECTFLPSAKGIQLLQLDIAFNDN